MHTGNMGLKKLVLDVLKPIREPTLVTLAKNLSKVNGVREVSIVVSEMDVETVTLVVTINGDDIDYEEVENTLRELGVALHSVDEVVFESEVTEESEEVEEG
ncbi:MAG: DUF211 domain-containing protein [Desulfurococcaceae archaeon]|nr:DUF211 domain-containing protein [Desulfurococcaceae archaeon]